MSKELHLYEAVSDFNSSAKMNAAIGALEELGVDPFDITPMPTVAQPPYPYTIFPPVFSDPVLLEPIRSALRDCGGRDIDIQDMK